MTSLQRSQQLHLHACDLEDRCDYYMSKGETEASKLLAEQASEKRLQYLHELAEAMTE